jgi:hypothetical protein
MAMELVATYEVGSGGAASIEFTGIPATGVDLLLVVSSRTNRAYEHDAIQYRLNSDSGNNYGNRYLQGTGSSVGSSGYTNTSARIDYTSSANSTSNTFGNLQIYIPNYTSAVAKSMSADTVSEHNNSFAYQTIWAHSWSGTSAVSSITITSATSSTFVQYSTASLYILS